MTRKLRARTLTPKEKAKLTKKGTAKMITRPAQQGELVRTSPNTTVIMGEQFVKTSDSQNVGDVLSTAMTHITVSSSSNTLNAVSQESGSLSAFHVFGQGSGFSFIQKAVESCIVKDTCTQADEDQMKKHKAPWDTESDDDETIVIKYEPKKQKV